MIPTRVTDRFPISVRSRGADYFKRKRVGLVSREGGRITATVEGSQPYQVTVETSKPVWRFTCECPAAFDRGLCKHMWATLLGADAARLLPEVDAGVEAAAVARVPEWKRQLEQIRRFGHYGDVAQTEPEIPWPDDRRIVYLLEIDVEGSFPGAIVEVRSERTDHSQRAIPFQFNDGVWLTSPDPIDREIASLLLGSHDPWNAPAPRRSFRIPPTMFQTTLRRICDSGRCFVHSRKTSFRGSEPVTWDDGPAWQFRVRVVPHEHDSWRVTGELLSADGTRALDDALLFFAAGYVVDERSIGRVQIDAAWRLLQALREGPPLIARQDELFELSAELALLGGAAVELPPGVEIERVRIQPRNRLRIRSVPRQWYATDLLEAQLGFDYGGITVGFLRGDAALIDRQQQRIIDRDFVAEQAALARLVAAGVRRDAGAGGPPRLTAPPRLLPQIVSSLGAEGWHIEADGKRFRAPERKRAAVSSGVDWFELSGDVQFGDQSATLPRLLDALRRNEHTVLLDDGTYGVLPAEWLQRFAGVAATGSGDAEGNALRFTSAQTGLLDALLATIPETTFDEGFARIRKQLQSFERIQPVDPPASFNGTLRGYQRDGLGWMLFLQKYGLGGCLADDMGLGKTVQVLALLERRRVDKKGPSLVVVPRSLIFNWHSEAKRFAPELRVRDYTGAARLKDPLDRADFDLLLTTYGTLRRDVPRLREINFDYLILDESQAIKNASTASSKAARLLIGKNRLALSGTPIENRIDELWSLFDFLNPGMLGTTSAFKHLRGDDDRELLGRAVRPLILRRTKKMVAPELPARIEQTLFVELDTKQRALYDELRDHYRNTLLQKVDQAGMEKTRLEVLAALLRLRQAALHPALIDAQHLKVGSAKLDMLDSQLTDIVAEGHRALVFSQFTSFLALVRERLDASGIIYEYLDGKTTNRQERVERFQNDPNCPVFLISLRAGGYGLNLTAADYVFVLDPWWNPAVEAQAIDRAHRIGQERSVMALRLIAKDTVEEKVLELQQQKRALVDAILGEDATGIGAIGREELELLLG